MEILVIGSTQFIGNSIAKFLHQQGYTVIPYTFQKEAELVSLYKKCRFQYIICADYNIAPQQLTSLLNFIIQHNIPYFLFCSSADVYGIPLKERVEEKQELKPTTLHGKKIHALECLLEEFSQQHPTLSLAILRLFSVVGSDISRDIGFSIQDNMSFMIRLMTSFANRKIKFIFYGDDYATPDGYPIRDFIHIIDVCEAIEIILRGMETQSIPYIEYNIGSGEGTSYLDTVNRASELLQMPIYTTIQPRKENDVARLVADITRMKLLYNWNPRYPLDQCILTTWRWYAKHL